MKTEDYMAIARSIPDDWYNDGEAKEVSSAIFYDIMVSTAMRSNIVIKSGQDLEDLLDIIAKERNVPVTEVLQDVQNVSLTVGAVKLFGKKYPAIAEQFPKDDFGNPVYPSDFLAHILGIDETVADNILNGVLKEYSIYLSDDNHEN